jgi:tetratricopeptide (TPR) repeat protein
VSSKTPIDLVNGHLERLDLTEAQKAAVLGELANGGNQSSSIVRIVSSFQAAIHREAIPANQHFPTLFHLIANLRAAEKHLDALRASDGATERVESLRRVAEQLHVTGDIAGTIHLVNTIEGEERHFEQAILAQKADTTTEIDRYRLYRAGTKELQISLALLDLRFACAATLIAERIALLEDDVDVRFELLRAQQDDFYVKGRDRGLNVDLIVSIEVGRLALSRAWNGADRVTALNDLAISLTALGELESGTFRLREAVAIHRTALLEMTREDVPVQWARTQSNLGVALSKLGEREVGTICLEEAISAFRAALEERTHEYSPIQWAMTQNNLGNAHAQLGQRETGTAHLKDAVAAYRAALEQWTCDAAPFDRAGTLNNLGNALRMLGERETGTANLEAAVVAYWAALEIFTHCATPYWHDNVKRSLASCIALLKQMREYDALRLDDLFLTSDHS